jgi:hypothetical protein
MHPRLKSKPTLHFISALFLTALVFPSLSRASVFDWNSYSWTAGAPSPGVTDSQIYSNVAGTGEYVTVSIANSASNPGGFQWAGGYPTVSSGGSGGTDGLTGQNALELSVNKNNSAGVTVTVKFSVPVSGLSYTLWDVDYSSGTFRDVITNITALNSASVTVGASSITTGVANTATGSGVGTVVFGTNTASNTTNQGQVTINFGTNQIKQFSFTWTNGDPAVSTQFIALGNINFTPLPEVGSSVAALALCGSAVGFQVVRNRRRRKK